LKAVVVGSVSSTATVIRVMAASEIELAAVFGFVPSPGSTVSGYENLQSLADSLDVPYHPFRSINDPETVQQVASYRPDLLFVVGLSQLVGAEIRAIATKATVGFHPTMLPRGRGRAPIAWLVMDQEDGAATLFEIGEGADDGAILVQRTFSVGDADDAASVEGKALKALESALDEWIPSILAGAWPATPQDEGLATWKGVRRPNDGMISWADSADDIVRLIRASTRPHPGAFTTLGDRLIRIWTAEVEANVRHKGVVGRILDEAGGHLLVQAGHGSVRVTSFSAEDGGALELRAGVSLGYSVQNELLELRHRVAALESRGGE
jgi:methionyl-tRNA formyltransferase